jgi:hypothetical protein
MITFTSYIESLCDEFCNNEKKEDHGIFYKLQCSELESTKSGPNMLAMFKLFIKDKNIDDLNDWTVCHTCRRPIKHQKSDKYLFCSDKCSLGTELKDCSGVLEWYLKDIIDKWETEVKTLGLSIGLTIQYYDTINHTDSQSKQLQMILIELGPIMILDTETKFVINVCRICRKFGKCEISSDGYQYCCTRCEHYGKTMDFLQKMS